MFQSPFVNALSIGGYDIKMYGVMMFCAIIFGIFISDYIAKKYYKSVNIDVLYDFLPFMIIFGIICARLYYVILNLEYYIVHPAEIIALWHGGISIHGAILGGLIAGIVYFKKNRLPMLQYADVITFGLVLAQAVGRWGNFFNSEAFGLPCNLPWKLYIAPQYRPLEYFSYSYFHPTFLYESIWCVIVFLILFLLMRKSKKYCAGMVFYAYFMLYSIGRFVIEGIRVDSVLNIGKIPIAQIVSVIVFLVGMIGYIYCYKKMSAK